MNIKKPLRSFLSSFISFVLLIGLFVVDVPLAYAAASLSCAKIADTAAQTVFTTFGGAAVYRLRVTNSGDASGNVTNIGVTPSGSMDDTVISVSIYGDTNQNGIVDGTESASGTGVFATDNTKKTISVFGSVGAGASKDFLIVARSNSPVSNTETFTASIAVVGDVTVTDDDNTCADGGLGANANALTATTTAPTITQSDGENNPGAATPTNSATGLVVQQIKLVNSTSTTTRVAQIRVLPAGVMSENTDTTEIKMYIDANGDGDTESGTDQEVTISSGQDDYNNDANALTTMNIEGNSIEIGASATVYILVTLDLAGTASDTETHSHSISTSNMILDTGGSATGSTATSNTITINNDSTPPTISGVYFLDNDNDGKIDAANITFSEAILDSTVVAAEFEFDTDALNDASANEAAAESKNTSVTLPSADSDANDEYYTLAITTDGNELPTTGNAFLHYTGSSLTDAASNALATCAGCGAESDAAKPGLSTAVLGNSGGYNNITLTFTEPVHFDITNQDGVEDAGDYGNGETLNPTTTSYGGIDAAGSVEQVGNAGTAGDYTQSAETCNSVAVSGSTVTITFNVVSGCYFSAGATAPAGTFTLDNNNYFWATGGYAASVKDLNDSDLTATISGSWDVTKPTEPALNSPSVTATTISPQWTAISDADFSRYQVYYDTNASVSLSDSAWTTSNDSALGTVSTATTQITGLTTGTTYYYKVYAIDTEGNLSTVTEGSASPTTQGGAGTKSNDNTPPGTPTGLTLTQSFTGEVTLTWTDPTDSDLSGVKIMRDGTLAGTVSPGVQTFTDTDPVLVDGTKFSYTLTAVDTTANTGLATAAQEIIIIVDTTPPEIESAMGVHRESVAVTFTEEFNSETVSTASFNINSDAGPLTVEAVSVDGTTATLTTEPQTLQRTYTVTVNGVEDVAGNAMVVGAGDSATFTGALVAAFDDVSLSDFGWALEAISWCRTGGICLGRRLGEFAPSSKIARLELATVIARSLLPIGKQDLTPDGTSRFSDVAQTVWYAPYINFIYDEPHLLIRGRQPDLFVPLGFAFRSEVVALMVRYIETNDTCRARTEEISLALGVGERASAFADVAPQDWYARVMTIGYDLGIVQGKEVDGERFGSPEAKINRVESVVMLKRAFEAHASGCAS